MDVVITEIGGTVGDIESQPFLEAIRQLWIELGRENVIFIHLTLVPYIKTAGELKTKPTQHSVKALQEIGIQPDILLCRAEMPLNLEIRKKIALFTNLKVEAIFSAIDVGTVYEIPLLFKKQGLGEIILQKLKLKKLHDNSLQWTRWVKKIKNLSQEVTISIVGKYVRHTDSYKSLYEALFHAGISNNVKVKLNMVEADSLLSENLAEIFRHTQGILIPGGFGIRGIEGMIKAAEYARSEHIPYFGICLGMQVATVEFMRNVIGLKDAHSTEFNAKTRQKIFLKLKELSNIEDMGHNMRLGSYSCSLKKDSLAFSVYKKSKIQERHRHRYELNNEFRKELEQKGLITSGINPERDP